ncbi:MAG: DUF2232 domain-containing protein, partial [Clostridia bacterium]|nr:DUF2232 domain-containing protein [Clostridia bacterium]
IISLAGATFGLLLCTAGSLLPFATVPVAAALAYILSASPLLTACALLYVPIGIAVAFCIFTEKRLSSALAVVTVVTCIATGAVFAVSVLRMYPGDYLERFKTFGSDFSDLLNSVFSSVQLPSVNGEAGYLSEEDIQLLISGVVMVIPAVSVITCQVLAYITIRCVKLGAKYIRMENILFGPGYKITIKLPTAILYLAASVLAFLSTKASVLAYSAINISYIMMPVCCAAGYNMLLGKYGLVRRLFPTLSKGTLTIIVVILLLLSPLVFAEVLSLYSAVGVLVAAIKRKLSENRNK